MLDVAVKNIANTLKIAFCSFRQFTRSEAQDKQIGSSTTAEMKAESGLETVEQSDKNTMTWSSKLNLDLHGFRLAIKLNRKKSEQWCNTGSKICQL